MKKVAKLIGVVVWGAMGCVTSEPIDLEQPDAGDPSSAMTSGAAGVSGAAGQIGSTSGSAGATRGTAGMISGISGAAGSAGGPAGASGVAGISGAAGASTSGGGGAIVDAGQPDLSPPRDSGATDAVSYAATWTDIYNKMFNNPSYASNCAGGACHDPGTQKGLDFSTQAKGYTTAKGHLIVGNPTGSQIVQKLSSGSMPAGRPKVPAGDLAVIKTWIMEGALNN